MFSFAKTIALAFGVLAGATMAQPAFPSHPVKLVVGAPPGGVNDMITRIVAQKMELGQPVIVENKNGAASMIAAEYVIHAPADGTTLLLVSQTVMTVAPIINKVTSFDPQKDLIPVAMIGSAPLVLVAGPALKADNVAELIAYAKAHPGDVDFGSGGIGTTPFMTASLFGVMTGTKLTSIPYPGEQAAMTEIMAGRLPFMFANGSTAMQHVKSGRLRALAISSKERVPFAEGIPTVSESGVPGFEAATWFGIMAPKETPPPVVARLNAEVRRVLRQPDVKARFDQLGFTLYDYSPAQFGRFVQQEHMKYAKLIRDANIKAD